MKKTFIHLITLFVLTVHSSQSNGQNIPTLDNLFELVWTTEGHRYSSNPVINDGLVFETFGIKYALNAETGEKLFFNNSRHQEIIKEMTNDSIVYFSIKRAGAAIINIYTGNTIYRSKEWIKKPIAKQPRIVRGEYAYFAVNDSTLCSLNIKTGKIKWKKTMNMVYDSPLDIGNYLLVADNNSVSKIEKSTGDTHERYDLKFPTMDMVLEDSLIYFFQKNKGLICYDTKSMEVKWKYDDLSSLKSNYEIINDSSIIYLANNQLHAISKKDGKVKWKTEGVGAGNSISTGASKDYIFSYTLLDDFSRLVACKKETGEVVFKGFSDPLNTNDNLDKPLTDLERYGGFRFAEEMHGNYIYLVSNTGDIFCFKAEE